MTKFDREKFEKDLIEEISKVQDKLGKKYNIKFSIDVTWQVSEGEQKCRELPAM